MGKALVVSLPLHGHMAPLVPMVRALVDAGDDVVVCSTPAFADRISQTGARFYAYRAELDGLAGLSDKTDQLSSLLMGLVERVLEADLPGLCQERPDYIVTDSLAPWGQWVAQILSVPVATSISTFAVNRHVLAFAASRGVRPKSVRLLASKLRHVSRAFATRRRLSRRYGVPGLGVFHTVFGHSALNIVHTSRAFQPCGETFDASFHFVGTSAVGQFAGREEHVPTVYISLGTIFNTDVQFYRTCLEAFRDEPLRVILSIGNAVARAELGRIPPNVDVAAFVPQLDVLRRASVFITHGGMNSVTESLCLGVPMLTVPQMGEQEIVSRRVEHVGAGLYLAKADVSPEALRSCVRRLSTDRSFAQHAASTGATLVAAGGPAKAAQVVQEFVRQRQV